MVFALLVASGLSSTQAAVMECHNCAEGVYESMARSRGIGEHVVYDFARGVLRGFYVECPGIAPEAVSPGTTDKPRTLSELSAMYNASRAAAAAVTAGCRKPLTVIGISPDPAVQAEFDDALAFYQLAGNRKVYELDIDISEIPFTWEHIRRLSAYDVVRSVPGSNTLTDWIRAGQDLPIGDRIDAIIAAAIQDALGGLFNADLVVNLTVTFTDGTKITYEWDLSVNRLTAVPGSARDGSATIPSDLGYSAQGEQTFDSTDAAERYVRWLISQGIPVTRSSPGRRVSCTWDGHELRCILRFSGS